MRKCSRVAWTFNKMFSI